DAPLGCFPTTRGPPLALLFMVDNSASMTTVDPGQTMSRWQIISTAISDFASAPENTGTFVGLDFFPETQDGGNILCSATDYQNLDAPFAAVPGDNNAQVAALGEAINARLVSGSTPTTPALQGAIASASAWQASHLEQQVYVVLVTDGEPNGCNSTI